MKILHTADWHLGKTTHGTLDVQAGINTRLASLSDAVAWCAETAKREEVDVVVIAGDIFDKRSVSGAELAVLHQFVSDMEGAGIHVLGVVGNHDQEWHIKRQSMPSIITPRIRNMVETVDYKGTRFCLIPYPRRASVVAHGWTAGDINTVFSDIIALALSESDAFDHFVVVSHLSVAGAHYSPEQNPMLMGQGDVIAQSSAFVQDGVDAVMLGHIHMPQEQGIVYYSGSLDRLDFGDERNASGVIIHDLGRSESKRIPYPDATVFKTVEVDDAEWLSEAFIGIEEGAFVRVKSSVKLGDAERAELYASAGRSGLVLTGITTPAPAYTMRDGGYVAEATTDKEALSRWCATQDVDVSMVDGAIAVMQEVDDEIAQGKGA